MRVLLVLNYVAGRAYIAVSAARCLVLFLATSILALRDARMHSNVVTSARRYVENGVHPWNFVKYVVVST